MIKGGLDYTSPRAVLLWVVCARKQQLPSVGESQCFSSERGAEGVTICVSMVVFIS